MKMLFRSIFAIKLKNKNSINLKIDFKNKIMKNKLLKNTSFLNLVLFLFLVTSVSNNCYAQCNLLPVSDSLCYGDQATYCVNVSGNSTFSYIQDFQSGIGNGEWSSSTTNLDLLFFNNTSVLAGTGNLSFGNDVVELNLIPSVSHDSILLEFDLYIHDSWDGNTQGETFSVEVDGNVVLIESFQNTQGPILGTNICATCNISSDLTNISDINGNLCSTFPGGCTGPWLAGTGVFRFSKMISHTSSSLEVKFIGLGLANGSLTPPISSLPVANDESWSIDNLSLQAFNSAFVPTVTWTDITNNNFISSDSCITVSPISTTDYQVVLDSFGVVLCADTVTVIVAPEINITASINNNSSQNSCNGSIFPSINGGSPTYSFNWDTLGTSFANSQNLLNLCENTYCLLVTDAIGCSNDTCFNIEWNPCDLNLVAASVLCNGDPTSIQITVDTTAGLGPFPYLPAPRFVYSVYSLNPLSFIQSQPFGLSSFTFNNPLIVAGDYLVTVYDNSWQDSCFNTISISDPDPIRIITTVNNTSATWNNDGSIQIDSLTGGVGGFSISWYDSSYSQSPPPYTPILSDSLLLDSIYFSHDFYGGYSILITDSNNCQQDTTLYVFPDSSLTTFQTVNITNETCFGFNDGKIFASVSNVGIPPYTFTWLNQPSGDTLRVDCLGCPPPSNYNPSHVATHTNLPPGFYSLSVSDALGNTGDFIDLIEIIAADSMYVVINPDQDSITLLCSQNILLKAIANPLPNVAALVPDTQSVFSAGANPVTSFILDLSSSNNSGISFSLYDSPNRTYSLTCSGTATDTSNPAINYDAAFMDWPLSTNSHNVVWGWNALQGNNVPLLNNALYDGVNHTYTWNFSANSNSAPNNTLLTGEYLHEFRVNSTIFNGQLTCDMNVIIDTVIYNYEWTVAGNPAVLSAADTLLTDSSIIVTTDYVVTVTNSSNCPPVSDTIRVIKDRNTLELDSLIITDVNPCYGDLTGVLDVYVTNSIGVAPFTYSLFSSDTNLIVSSSASSFSGLSTGQYFIQVEDTIGCINPYASVFIDQPDTIFACGVDEKLDTTFNIFTHTVNADDPSTWIFQTIILPPNFQYLLEVSGTFGLTSLQFNTNDFDQDAAFLLNPLIVNPNTGPFWTVNGDEIRPDIDVLNPNNTYFYYNPSDVNGSGPQNDYFTGAGLPLSFAFNDPDDTLANNQGNLIFTLHKISCTQIDTAYTCKDEALGFAFVRPESENGSLGGVPFDPNGIPNDGDEYYETEWIKYNPFTGATIATVQGGVGAGPSDTIVNLSAGSYKVVVIDSLGCSEFIRYLEVIEPIDTFATILDTVINVSCKYDSTGEIHLSNFGGFDSIAFNGSSIIPISSKTSRYAVLLKDNSVYNPCGDVNAIVPSANYSDTVITFSGVLDSIIFDNLTASRYRVYIYDSIPDATYGQYDPFTGELLATPFNYMQCPNIIDVFISEPCDSLRSVTTVLSNVNCWGEYTASAEVSAIGGAEPWIYSYQWHNGPLFGIGSPLNGIGNVGPTVDSLWADTLIPFPGSLWHTVTVTDPNGCTIEDSVEISHINRKIIPFYVDLIGDTIFELNFIEDSVSCFDLCDGEVSLSTLGGDYPHSYTWDVSPGTSVFNQPDTVVGLCEGGHDVLIIDNAGCRERIRFRINEPNKLYAIASEVDPISCFGFNDGTATSYGIGGNNVSNQQSSYTFVWFIDSLIYNSSDSIIGDSLFIDNLPPGIHVLQITDYKGCVSTDTVEIIEPTQLSVIIVDTSTVYAYCEFTNSAKLCAQAFGGTPGYLYQWDDQFLQNNSSPLFESSQFCAENLEPINVNTVDGSYNVVVVDDRNCFATASIKIDTITNTFNSNSIHVSVSNVNCHDGFDGSISVDSIVMIDSLVVTNGIQDTVFFTSVVYPPFSSYSFVWTGTGGFTQFGPNISSLYSGSYAVIVTDTNGCPRTKNIQLTQPQKLEYGIYNSIDQTCIGDGTLITGDGSCDGQIIVNITGGTGNYYYDVSQSNIWPIPSPFQVQIINDTLIDELCSGFYTVYITDDNGCDGEVIPGGIANQTINTLVNVIIPGVVTDPTKCADSDDGVARIQFPGANPLFNYSWNTSTGSTTVSTAITDSIFSIGSYILVAHYANTASFGINYEGCDVSFPFNVSGPLPILGNPSITDVSCWGESDGGIIFSPSGGFPQYTYAWDTTVSLPPLSSLGDTLGSNNSQEIGLLAGTYGVTITDSKGCDFSDTIVVNQPDKLQNNFSITDVKCNGDATGVIQINPIGGTGPFPFVVRAMNGAIRNSNSLETGNYQVTITDGNNCSITDTVFVGQPELFSITSLVVQPISCFGDNDGQIEVFATGGLKPYIYLWGNGTSFNPVTSLSEGNITLLITDANGCPLNSSGDIKEPEPIKDNYDWSMYGIDLNQVSCLGASDGWIELNPSGGVAFSNDSYNYTWSGPNFNSSSQDIYNLGIGKYFVDIEDANGCIYNFDYTLIAPVDSFIATVKTLNYAGASHPPFNVTFIDSTKDIAGNSIVVNHYWSWNNLWVKPIIEYQQFSYEFTEVGLNEVYVVVENVNTSCKDTVTFPILVQGVDFITNVFSPNGDGINDEFIFNENGIKVVFVEIYNRWGSLVMNWTELDKGWDGRGSDGQELPDGVYFYVLTADGEDGHYYENKGSITLLR